MVLPTQNNEFSKGNVYGKQKERKKIKNLGCLDQHQALEMIGQSILSVNFFLVSFFHY